MGWAAIWRSNNGKHLSLKLIVLTIHVTNDRSWDYLICTRYRDLLVQQSIFLFSLKSQVFCVECTDNKCPRRWGFTTRDGATTRWRSDPSNLYKSAPLLPISQTSRSESTISTLQVSRRSVQSVISLLCISSASELIYFVHCTQYSNNILHTITCRRRVRRAEHRNFAGRIPHWTE